MFFILFALLVLRGGSAAGAQTEGVLLLAHHKTGTALMMQLSRVLALSLPNATGCSCGLVAPLQPGNGTVRVLYLPCSAEKKNDPKRRVDRQEKERQAVEWLLAATDTGLHSLLFPPASASPPTKLHVVHFVRPPLDLVTSAYLYHASEPDGEMWWLAKPNLIQPPAQLLPSLYAADRDPGGRARREAQLQANGWRVPSSCDPAAGAGLSWVDMLHCLNTTDGLRAEGWHALSPSGGEVATMAATAAQLRGAAAPSRVQLPPPAQHSLYKHQHQQHQPLPPMPQPQPQQQWWDVKSVVLEDWSERFEDTTRDVLEFVGVAPGAAAGRALELLDRAANLQRPDVRSRAGGHVTSGKQNKTELEQTLRESDPLLFWCLRRMSLPALEMHCSDHADAMASVVRRARHVA